MLRGPKRGLKIQSQMSAKATSGMTVGRYTAAR